MIVPKKGQRIRLISSTDPWTLLDPGSEGEVINVDSLGTVHVLWDSGARLGLIAGEDQWEIVYPPMVFACNPDESAGQA